VGCGALVVVSVTLIELSAIYMVGDI